MAPGSAIVTGAGAGIGEAIALLLASKGWGVTVMDMDAAAARSVAAECRRRGSPLARAEGVDVTNSAALARAFDSHVAEAGSLSLVVNNAGIAERGDMFEEGAEAKCNWRKVVEVDLTALINGTILAVKAMKRLNQGGGNIVNVASAGALFPMPFQPAYAAAKAGVVHFTNSCSDLADDSEVPIAVRALCPQFVDTALVRSTMEGLGDDVATALIAETGGMLLTTETVAEACMSLITDPTEKTEATTLLITNGKAGNMWWPPKRKKAPRSKM